ncbi:DNA translocase FtsK 4TM domain-containing protein, partial [Xenorhabdus nematophila]
MNQEYTEDKRVKLKKISSGRRLLEAVLLVIAICAVYLMVALISFNPSDPSWSQTSWHEPVHNWGGSVGAWLSDTLFSALGILAYAVPPLMLLGCWNAFRQKDRQEYVDFFTLALRVIGALALILTSCGLAALNIDDLDDFAAGGVVGSLFSNAILPWFNILGATLALLGVWAVGFTLFTGWSWLAIAEKIGAIILDSLSFVVNRGRNETEYDYDELEEEIVSGDSISEHKQPEQADKNELAKTATETDTVDMDDVLLTAPTVVELANTDSALSVVPSAPVTEPVQTEAIYDVKDEQEKEPVHYIFELPDDYQSKTEYDKLSPATNDNTDLKNPAVGIVSSVVVTKNPQVKQGIGPEMPRPNPVRIPTRRELYGIKVPSHGLAEHLQRAEKERQDELIAEANEQQLDEQQQDLLRQQFLEQQRERYGNDFEAESKESCEEVTPPYCQQADGKPTVAELTERSHLGNRVDEIKVDRQEVQHQEALRIAFEQQQHERYQIHQPIASIQVSAQGKEPELNSVSQMNDLGQSQITEPTFKSSEPLIQPDVQEKKIVSIPASHESKTPYAFAQQPQQP